MKQLTQIFNEILETNPNLSSFICFGRLVKKLKLSKRNISAGFRKLVEKDDYEKRSYEKLLKHLENMA